MDILVCPFDKVSSLELLEFKTHPNANIKSSQSAPLNEQEPITKEGVYKDNDNNDNNNTNNQELTINTSALSSEIIEEGLLLCRTCMRFYPITEEIPIIMPDELRDKKKDLEFLKTWNKSIPENLLKNLKPWTMKI
ncbi:hypothetical protein BH23THE1_BH23THE1_29830 [soil metagenome]